MITQQHENEIQQKAQAPSPAKEHRWRVALFSILGVVLPLVAGLMTRWPWGMGWGLNEWFLAIGVSAVVSGAVGAFLLCFAFRVWWVAVFAGVAWIVGDFLGSLERQLIEMGVPVMPAYEPFWSNQVTFITVALVPLLFGMALGAAGGLALGKRRALQQ